jgi:CheY-like chemotaxis protein
MRALVADDYANTRMILGAVLEEFGYAVETAENGKKALEKASEPGFVPELSVVLTDLDMNGSDGLGLALGLRKLGYNGPIVLMSCYPAELGKFAGRYGLDESAAAAQFSKILPKPLGLDEIKKALPDAA